MTGRMSGERGAALVEFALIVSILLTILFAIVQFGLAFHVYEGMQAASNEGARLASLQESTADEIYTRVLQTLPLANPAEEVECGSLATARPGQYCIDVTPTLNQPCNL